MSSAVYWQSGDDPIALTLPGFHFASQQRT
jgi:hypothetical protein